MRVILILFILFSINKSAKSKDQEKWKNVYLNSKNFITGDFLLKQLSYFAGWRVHQAGSKENNLLAEKLFSDWRNWSWPIVRKLNFSVHLPNGPPLNGAWNEISLLNRSSMSLLNKLQNYVEINVTDNQHKNSETCINKNLYNSPRNHCLSYRFPAYTAYSRPGIAIGRPVFVGYGSKSELLQFVKANYKHKKIFVDPLCSPDIIVIAQIGNLSLASKLRTLVDFCHKQAIQRNITTENLPAGMLLFLNPLNVQPPSGKLYPSGIGLPNDAPFYTHASMARIQGGDPETPHLPSIDGVFKIYKSEDVAMTPIPIQSISYGDARRIFNSMRGPKVPSSWLPSLAKHIGPNGHLIINLTVNNKAFTQLSNVTNVLGIMPGSGRDASQYVIFGNHRDAWLQGASDPGSGNAILQAVAYTLGIAYSRGWRPRRTIIIASWDAEEVSLIGSTETVELLRAELISRAVVYLNQDCPVKGDGVFNGRSDELISEALISAMKDVIYDETLNISFLDKWALWQGNNSSKMPHTMPILGRSDHVAFEYKLGIPSMYPELRPAPPLFTSPSYHTAYDTVDMMVRFTDPSSSNGQPLPMHRRMAELNLNLILRFSSSFRLPIHPQKLAASLYKSWNDLIAEHPNLSQFGITTEFVNLNLKQFLTGTSEFEAYVKNVTKSNPKCIYLLNDILGQLSKHFIYNFESNSPRHVLIDSSYSRTHNESYFPKIRKLLKMEKKTDLILKSLKFEMSLLTKTINSATVWIKGGLLGLDNLISTCEK